MSIRSHKASPKKSRAVQAPQRSNGKLRVAAILAAAEALIAERGYEGATMAEIATRSNTRIGSLYRFFPNKESLADTIVSSAHENIDARFDEFDTNLASLSLHALADGLITVLLEQMFTRPAVMKLLDSGPEWSVKREEFRGALVRRIAKTLTSCSPNLPKRSATDIAIVLLLNVKTIATHQELPPSASDEIRDMTKLYLQDRLASAWSAK